MTVEELIKQLRKYPPGFKIEVRRLNASEDSGERIDGFVCDHSTGLVSIYI